MDEVGRDTSVMMLFRKTSELDSILPRHEQARRIPLLRPICSRPAKSCANLAEAMPELDRKPRICAGAADFTLT